MSDKNPSERRSFENENLRIFTDKEYKKISADGLGFVPIP
jgi:hypothetical protein